MASSNLTQTGSGQSSALSSGSEVPMYEIGGVSVPLADAIVLSCFTQAATDYVTMRKSGNQYQVPAGKKLIIVAIEGQNAGTSSAGANIGYADAATTGGAPAGLQLFAGSSGVAFNVYSAHSGNKQSRAVYFEIPTGKYPLIYGQTAVNQSWTILGYLVDL
jgi:hypothetical protein